MVRMIDTYLKKSSELWSNDKGPDDYKSVQSLAYTNPGISISPSHTTVKNRSNQGDYYPITQTMYDTTTNLSYSKNNSSVADSYQQQKPVLTRGTAGKPHFSLGDYVLTTESQSAFGLPSLKAKLPDPETKPTDNKRDYNIINFNPLSYQSYQSQSKYTTSDHFPPLVNGGKKYNIITGQEQEMYIPRRNDEIRTIDPPLHTLAAVRPPDSYRASYPNE